MSRIAIINNFTSFIDFFLIILMLICVHYFLIDLNYRNIQSTNSTDLHGRSKTECSVITMATFIWKIGCSFCVRLKSTISITSLSEFSRGGGEAERQTIQIRKWYLFFVIVCLSASIRHHDQKITFIFSRNNNFIIHYDLFFSYKNPDFSKL